MLYSKKKLILFEEKEFTPKKSLLLFTKSALFNIWLIISMDFSTIKLTELVATL